MITGSMIRIDNIYPHIVFCGKGQDVRVLELKNDGRIFIHGKEIGNNKEVVDALRECLTGHGLIHD